MLLKPRCAEAVARRNAISSRKVFAALLRISPAFPQRFRLELLVLVESCPTIQTALIAKANFAGTVYRNWVGRDQAQSLQVANSDLNLESALRPRA